GNVLVPVDKEEVVQAARELVNDGHITAIAILFLNSYVNSRNEEEARKAIQENFPSLHVITSSEVLPEILEYERFSATVLTAYLRPVIEGYIENLKTRL